MGGQTYHTPLGETILVCLAHPQQGTTLLMGVRTAVLCACGSAQRHGDHTLLLARRYADVSTVLTAREPGTSQVPEAAFLQDGNRCTQSLGTGGRQSVLPRDAPTTLALVHTDEEPPDEVGRQSGKEIVRSVEPAHASLWMLLCHKVPKLTDEVPQLVPVDACNVTENLLHAQDVGGFGR